MSLARHLLATTSQQHDTTQTYSAEGSFHDLLEWRNRFTHPGQAHDNGKLISPDRSTWPMDLPAQGEFIVDGVHASSGSCRADCLFDLCLAVQNSGEPGVSLERRNGDVKSMEAGYLIQGCLDVGRDRAVGEMAAIPSRIRCLRLGQADAAGKHNYKRRA
jgi:hypothetical protein